MLLPLAGGTPPPLLQLLRAAALVIVVVAATTTTFGPRCVCAETASGVLSNDLGYAGVPLDIPGDGGLFGWRASAPSPALRGNLMLMFDKNGTAGGNGGASGSGVLSNTTEPCAGLAICDVGNVIVRDARFRRRRRSFAESKFSPGSESASLRGRVAMSACAGTTGRNPGVGCVNIIFPEGSSELDISFVSESNPVNRGVGTTTYAAGPNAQLLVPTLSGSDMNSRGDIYLLSVLPCMCVRRTSPFSNLLLSGDQNISLNVGYTLKYKLKLLNGGTLFPELSWEETLFPVGTLTIVVIQFCTLLLAVFGATALISGRLPRKIVVVVGIAALISKVISNSLAAGYFWQLAKTGESVNGLAYARIPFMIFADATTVAFLALSCVGYRFFPSEWRRTSHSGLTQVQVCVVLQLCVSVANNVVIPFHGHTAEVFAVGGGMEAMLLGGTAIHNAIFFTRYMRAVSASFIRPRTTPIPGMLAFFLGCASLVAGAYVTKFAFLVNTDYLILRPDLLWVSFEAVDAGILLALTLALYPRASFGLYTDMSVTDNARLRMAEAWHSRGTVHARFNESTDASVGPLSSISSDHRAPPSATERNDSRGGSTTGSVLNGATFTNAGERRQDGDSTGGAATLGSESTADGTAGPIDASPAWIDWQPGIPLPVPTSDMWRWRGLVGSLPSHLGQADRLADMPQDPVRPFVVLGVPAATGLEGEDAVFVKVGVPVHGPGSLVDLAVQDGDQATECAVREKSNPIRFLRRRSERVGSAVTSAGRAPHVAGHDRGNSNDGASEGRRDSCERASTSSSLGSGDGTVQAAASQHRRSQDGTAAERDEDGRPSST